MIGTLILVSGVTPVFAAVLPILAVFAMRLQAYLLRTTSNSMRTTNFHTVSFSEPSCINLRISENSSQLDFHNSGGSPEQVLSENIAGAQAADIDRPHAHVRLVLLHS